jgi:MoaA/NifB/PqqE/SkfB family radical SAM enzyme
MWKGRSLFHERPLWAALYVTRRCNLSCEYCILEGKRRPDPPTIRLTTAIDKLKELGLAMVVITGGEPTLREDLVQLVAHSRRRGLVTCLNTNGTRLTSEVADRLGAAGLDVLNISIDGLHARAGRAKALDRSQGALEAATVAGRRHGFEVVCSQVLSAGNIGEVGGFLDSLHRMGLSVSPNICYPLTHAFAGDGEMSRLGACLDLIRTKKAGGYAISTSDAYLAFAERQVRERKRWECSAGRSFFAVDVDGGVSFCDRLEVERFDRLGMSIYEMNSAGLREMAGKAKKCQEEIGCSEDCMANCAFETDFFIHHPLKYAMAVGGKNGNGRGDMACEFS